MMEVKDKRTARILDALSATSEPYRSLFYTMVYTGLWQGEVIALQWQDVDLESGTISVRHTMWYPRRSLESFRRRKPTFTRPRTVRMTDHLVDLLSAWKPMQSYHRSVFPERWQAAIEQFGELVFTTRFGTPIDHRGLQKKFSDLREFVGEPDLKMHDLAWMHSLT